MRENFTRHLTIERIESGLDYDLPRLNKPPIRRFKRMNPVIHGLRDTLQGGRDGVHILKKSGWHRHC
jgi:hypothetical protein